VLVLFEVCLRWFLTQWTQGHSLLDRISGAQAAALASAVEKHCSLKSGPHSSLDALSSYFNSFWNNTVQPLSSTTQKPEAAPTNYTPSTTATRNGTIAVEPTDESPEELDKRCEAIMNQVRRRRVAIGASQVLSCLLLFSHRSFYL
jgi:hypothetical protein